MLSQALSATVLGESDADEAIPGAICCIPGRKRRRCDRGENSPDLSAGLKPQGRENGVSPAWKCSEEDLQTVWKKYRQTANLPERRYRMRVCRNRLQIYRNAGIVCVSAGTDCKSAGTTGSTGTYIYRIPHKIFCKKAKISIFAAENRNVERFGCLQPHKKMLK